MIWLSLSRFAPSYIDCAQRRRKPRKVFGGTCERSEQSNYCSYRAASTRLRRRLYPCWVPRAAPACPRSEVRKNRHEPGWAPPRPAPPLSRFRATGRVRTTRAPSVRVVVTRAAFCVYTTKCRRKAASWLLRSMTLRSHFGTCLALAGKCARKRAVPSLSFAHNTWPFALASGYNHSRRLPIDTNAGD